MTSEAQRLHDIEARFAIADLIHGYARLVRYDTPGEVAELFAPDGWFEIRDGHPDRPDYSVRNRLEGPAQIRNHLEASAGGPHPVPLIHNLIVEVEGDQARANCMMEGQIFGTSHGVFGEYRDTFRRFEGRWLFATREFTIFDPVTRP